jgi:3-oxoacyl-[acyl-carrier-protein] synthase-1
MKSIFVLAENNISSLGFTERECFENLIKGNTGISLHENPALSPIPVWASLVNREELNERFEVIRQQRKFNVTPTGYTRLEKMLILSISESIVNSGIDPGDPGIVFVLSTTKGNIDLLEEGNKSGFGPDRIFLWSLANVISRFFCFVNEPVIVSNACISGVMSLIEASRLLRAGQFHTAVVAGGDLASEFVISGFQSFQALSPEPCKPFDLDRKGLSLGEGSSCIIISTHRPAENGQVVAVSGGSVSNDANHISGPSRTGEELAMAIRKSLTESGLEAGMIDYISAHGTATPYNDEMEARALSLSGLSEVPVNSFKGYWGHTLGASGLMEATALIGSMKRNLLIKSTGYETPGVPAPLNVIKSNTGSEIVNALKTASGFGGCNAALVFSKV